MIPGLRRADNDSYTDDRYSERARRPAERGVAEIPFRLSAVPSARNTIAPRIEERP